MTTPVLLSELSIAPESRTKPISGRNLRFLCRLGAGGMAEVHLANAAAPLAEPRLVVVKRMHQQHQDDPATVRMFLDEARLALCLSHPNIVKSERLGMFEGRHGIVMEFLDGQPFHHVLKRAYEAEGSLSFEILAQVAIAALDGLHYAHELKDIVGNPLGLVHRDVSPQNLFVTYDGAVKLLDFGIAKNSMQDGRTRTGLLKGKIAYMAPEQARGEELDRRADVWSLGVVLWEAATGSRLFRGANEAATLNLTLSEDVAAPSQRRPDLPAELEQILMRALRRNPDERYASAAEMRDDLEAWLSSRALSATASLSQLMQRLFGREMREQRAQLQGLLNAQPESAAESGVTLVAPSLGADGSRTGLRGVTQASTVTDLMDELTRQRRVTTRLLGALLSLVGLSLLFGVYWTLVLRPAQGRELALAPVMPIVTRAPPREPAPLAAATHPSSAPMSGASPNAATSAAPPAPTVRRSPQQAPRATRPQTPPIAAVRTTTELTPAAAPAPPPVEIGYLNLDTSPWSTVSLGGKILGQTPLVRASLPAGTHVLVLTNPEFGLKTTYQITIAAGRTTARRVGLDP